MARKTIWIGSKSNGALKPQKAYSPHGNGNFVFRMPKLTPKALAIPCKQRLALIADFHASEASVAAQLGVTGNTVHNWRVCLAKLTDEKKSLMEELLQEPLRGSFIAKQYYDHGSNWIRANYELTNVATRGLILWLALGQQINRVSTARK